MAHPSGDPIPEVTALLRPVVEAIIRRITVDEFTTVEFIEVLQEDPHAERVYQDALGHWPERDEHLARMVVHGQVVPQLLRGSGLVEWIGFAHGESDPYAIPAWWRRLRDETT